MNISLPKLAKPLQGAIDIGGSKSISNRWLMMNAIAGCNLPATNLSDSEDTRILSELLKSKSETLDCGKAGTVFRFLLAFKAFRNGHCVLTGDERMQQRPIAPLVDALRSMGADIRYTNKEGFPPVRIFSTQGLRAESVRVDASVSSQFLSALAMIAPYMPHGLTIIPEGKIVSNSYFNMTLSMMEHFGIRMDRLEPGIKIHKANYDLNDCKVESDWSSASYFYALCALKQGSAISIKGLSETSIQGDAIIAKWMEKFGVKSSFTDEGVVVTSVSFQIKPSYEFDFIDNPDLFQTIAFMCAVFGCQVLYKGLDTLKDKETDRITAVKNELYKVGVHLVKLPQRMSKTSGTVYYLQEGKANFEQVFINTYGDHRMAMAASLLCVAGQVVIERPELVTKSNPDFFTQLANLAEVKS